MTNLKYIKTFKKQKFENLKIVIDQNDLILAIWDNKKLKEIR